MNIKTPPMPDAVNAFVIQTSGKNLEFLLKDRDRQWLELVGPVVEAANKALKQFTKMPSTLKDSEARCQLHAALRQITEEQT